MALRVSGATSARKLSVVQGGQARRLAKPGIEMAKRRSLALTLGQRAALQGPFHRDWGRLLTYGRFVEPSGLRGTNLSPKIDYSQLTLDQYLQTHFSPYGFSSYEDVIQHLALAVNIDNEDAGLNDRAYEACQFDWYSLTEGFLDLYAQRSIPFVNLYKAHQFVRDFLQSRGAFAIVEGLTLEAFDLMGHLEIQRILNGK